MRTKLGSQLQTLLVATQMHRNGMRDQFRLRELQYANAERLAPWFALVPIPVAWFIVYVFVWLTHWVRRGFQPTA